jgi:type VI secretion system protein ImpG
MSEKLLLYYERELLFIRQMAKEFAEQHPAIANRLGVETDDPHVERILQAFAFLTARVHNKIDDEFPELTDSLLGVLYPHYLAPVPSMSIAQFELDPGRAQLPEGFRISQHSAVRTQPVGDPPLACKFRTGYPVTLWPVELKAARFQPPAFPPGLHPPPGTAAALFLELHCQGEMRFANLTLDKLRFYLHGDKQVIPNLYELLFNHTLQVVFRPLERDARQSPIVLEPSQCLYQVGFERDEGLLSYPNQSFLGYRLLTEFFTFPAKFMFLDLGGWKEVRGAGFASRVEVILFFNRTLPSLEQGIDASTFRLGCTPVINLFDQLVEARSLTHTRYEYPIVPDVAHPRGLEVYSVDEVTGVDATRSTTTEYQPFYSFRHGQAREKQRAFWYTSRRPSLVKDDQGTEVYLHLVDLDFNPRQPAESVLVMRTKCTNRDLPNILRKIGDKLTFDLEAAAPLSGIRCLRSPTPSLRPPPQRGAHWRLVSHLCLNHLSLSDPRDESALSTGEGCAALKEILRLYDFSDPETGQELGAVARKVIDGILSVTSRRVVDRTGSPTSSGFARGLEVTIKFDERNFAGIGVFLFACVLERFLGLYASINSFTKLVGKTREEGYFKKWPPRAAEHQLL